MNTLEYRDSALWLLDQTRLPHETVLLECRTHEDVAKAIRRLSVRGAPAIGLAAAYAAALAAREFLPATPPRSFRDRLNRAFDDLQATRPTAVNLAWALTRLRQLIENPALTPADIVTLLEVEADRMLVEDLRANRAMGEHGASLIHDGANVLTHCNAGSLATGAFGTALGVIQTAHSQGKHIHIWVDETRPLLQGARLTTWELKEAGIPHTLITDNMAAHFMSKGRIDLVMVGADRIAANGDGANKIGTYGVAVLAHAHSIPFYFVAPTTTVDLQTASGKEIPIEERAPEEVTSFRGVTTAPEGTRVANPAFDVTPARLVSAIVTEAGNVTEPFSEGLRAAVETAARMNVPEPV
jgi:methylthioribose-1-phosphate isomerase